MINDNRMIYPPIPELTENRLRFDGMPDDAPIGESFLWNVYPQNVTAGLL